MHLRPVLGPIQLFFYAVGVIIGAGVYSVIGGVAGIAQSGLWLSFVIGALVALLTGLSYAEMATSFPVAGAEYAYIRRAAPSADWAAFGVGAIILFGGAATATTVAVAFGGYMKAFVDAPISISALGLLGICTALSIIGMRESSWANVLFTSIEIVGLLLVIAAGLMQENSASKFVAPIFVEPQPGVIAGAAVLFFVYLGFEELANVVEEARNPGRDVPRAMFWGLGITTALYMLVALAVLSLASPSELAASEAPLAMAIEKIWPRAGILLSAIALFATANTVLITLIATSRLAFSMARDGELPEMFGWLLPVRRTPWIACILAFVLASVLLPIENITILAGISSFSALLAFVAVNMTLIALRYREPERPRPFRVPLSVGRVPILPVAAIASILLLLGYFEWAVYLGGGIAIALSAIAFGARKWWRRIRVPVKVRFE